MKRQRALVVSAASGKKLTAEQVAELKRLIEEHEVGEANGYAVPIRFEYEPHRHKL